MLQILRERSSGLFVKTILWGLVLAFVGTIVVVWGYGRDKMEKPVAKVAGLAITQAEYKLYYDSTLRNIREMFGGQELSSDMIKQFNVEKIALDSVIMDRLEYLAAQDTGMIVTDDELRSNIENTKDFQRDGRFDKAAFFAVLKANRLSPKDYEKRMRRELTVRKITRMISESVPVTDQEVRNAYISNNEQLKIRYLAVTPQAVASKVRVDDKLLEERMKKESFRFTLPEQRKVERVTAHPEGFRSGQKINEAEVQSYYNAHKSDFAIKEDEVRARHILFEMPKNPTPKEMADTAQKAFFVMEKLKKGANFAEMAKKYSNDPGSATQGGDLGFFPRGKMVPEFDKAAFDLPVGKISDLVRTNFGLHIIQVQEKRAAGPLKFEEAAKSIREKLVNDAATLEAQRRISVILADKSGKSLEELAKAQKCNYGTYTLKAGKRTENLVGSDVLVERIFQLNKGETAGPVDAMGAFHIVRLLAVIPPHQPQLAEVRKEVEEVFRKEEESRLAGDAVDAILKGVRAGADLKSAAKEIKEQPKESGFVKRRDNEVDGIKQGSPLITAAFALKPGAYDKVMIGDAWYVITVAEKKPADMAEFDKERGKIKSGLLFEKGRAAVREWQTALRKDAETRGVLTIDKQVNRES